MCATSAIVTEYCLVSSMFPSNELLYLNPIKPELVSERGVGPRMVVVTMAEVALHTTEAAGLWTVIHGKVYDVTAFLAEHPGGAAVLEENSGRDSTEEFEDAAHSADAREMLADYFVGELEVPPPTGWRAAVAERWRSRSTVHTVVAASALVLVVGILTRLVVARCR